MQPGSGSSSKSDRNLAERNRRMHMKSLCSMLASLVLPQDSKAKPPKHVLLDQAAAHVKHLQERIEELKQRKELLKGDNNPTQEKTRGAIAPVIKLRNFESTLEVNLISGPDKKSMLREVISVLEEEGAEVVAASYCTVDDKVSYTVHSQAIIPRIGIETSTVDERLKKLIL
ncbi:hypothetical protein L1049_023817 [Liquidambar formosana]|uniref:BHLH domain-containing protein n=1 Tax=Liquidambar formosana TaxID=63359 RepID=A0AAP0RZ73_LIQFO